MNTSESKEILADVIKIVKKAGKTVLSFYDTDYAIKDKGKENPVTQADLESEHIILRGLSGYGYGVLSEETSDDKKRVNMERAWVIDPMDGTKDFIDKTGEFTIMVGLVEKGEPILGVIYQPVEHIVYYAWKNNGAYKKFKKDKPLKLKVSKEKDYGSVTMFSSRFHRSKEEDKLAKKLGIGKITTCGSSLKVCRIAEGIGDLNFNPSNKTWEYDICASDIILREAGGVLTDSKGMAYKYNKDNPRNENGYVASNGVMHDEIIKEIKKIMK